MGRSKGFPKLLPHERKDESKCKREDKGCRVEVLTTVNVETAGI